MEGTFRNVTGDPLDLRLFGLSATRISFNYNFTYDRAGSSG